MKDPKKALNMLENGLSKEEIFSETNMTIAVKNASFEIYEGEIFVIMGLSGSGKSTLVRLLNRLIEPSAGQIFIDDIDLNYKELIDIRRKKISMVFQSFALMPHMNIINNASFGLEVSGIHKEERYEADLKALEQVGLEHHTLSYPDELSGGMQQRIGLVGALANNPDIMLRDEAFSALDPLIRTEIQDELLILQEKEKRTIVFISHNLDEAIRIGDRIAIMQNGEISQIGTTEEIINKPENDYVRSFFKGVDVTYVLRASHIVKKVHSTIINKESTGIKSAIVYIGDFDEKYSYFLKKSGKYLEILTINSLKVQKDLNGSIHEAIINEKAIQENLQISDFIKNITDHTYPWGNASTVQEDRVSSVDWGEAALQPIEYVKEFDIFHPFDEAIIPLDDWTNIAIDWTVINFREVFLALQISSKKLALGTMISFFLIGFIGSWEESMITLSLVITAVLFSLIIGLPLGIWTARSDTADKIMRPILDGMQTIPAFVYLIPIVMLFGIGNVPGVIVIIIFALPPLIRLTNLGIRQVPDDLIEDARSFGASSSQMLWKVQIPISMPTIMAGVNKTLMLSLSMVVISSMIAVGGLGQMVLRGIGRLDIGLAAISGLGIVLLVLLVLY